MVRHFDKQPVEKELVLKYAVYFDDDLPVAVYKHKGQAEGFVLQMKEQHNLDYRIAKEGWSKVE